VPKPAQTILLISSLALVTVIVSSPLAASTGHAGPLMLANRMFSPYCHQSPERSIFVLGWKMPVCARCFGIYVGMLLGSILYALPRGARGSPPAWILLAAAAPLCADGFMQLTGFWASNNPLRLATGLIFGFSLPFYLIPVGDDAIRKGAAFIRNRR
jgi:uncharacterized membrane protein